MRCPKCQYISFDSGDRCRNCGYEFSLALDEPSVDVKIRRDDPRSGRTSDASYAALDTPVSGSNTPADQATANGGRRPLTMEDLPLFTERFADDQAPLVTPPAVPRPPLSVRRANPAPRGRTRPPLPDELSLDLALDPRDPTARAEPRAEPAAPPQDQTAGVVRRVVAGLIDTAVLTAIHATVVYLTLRLAELQPDEWHILPLVPLVAFLLLLSGGYFVLFTAAGGQTIGKMATGIRVVNATDGGDGPLRVAFATAVVRAVASLGSVLTAGAGFLPMLFTADRRAFHDRVAGTRVVRA